MKSIADILKDLQKIDKNFEFDINNMGFGIRADNGEFVRVKPFWISLKEIRERKPNENT